MIALRAAADWWNGFFHSAEPASSVALFRIVFGLILLSNALLFLRDARFWIGPAGLLSDESYCSVYGHSRFTALRYLPAGDGAVHVIIGLHILAATCLTIGFETRWSAVLTFVTLLSIHHRNPVLVYGADDVMRLMTFLLIFSRAGDDLSIDVWTSPPRFGAPIADGWCTRLMQLQVSFIYLAAFLNKLRGRRWLDGTAAFYAAEVADFRRGRLPDRMRTLFWSRAGTWSILGTELLLGSAIWIRELRYPVLALGLAMHLVLERFMNLQLFGATMIACLLLFLDPADVARALRALHLS
jgi:uncharacterized membrane protein YphA (DoxX/SURF4 family)